MMDLQKVRDESALVQAISLSGESSCALVRLLLTSLFSGSSPKLEWVALRFSRSRIEPQVGVGCSPEGSFRALYAYGLVRWISV